MGWWLCSADICKNGDGREEVQTWSILSGESNKTHLLGGVPVDLLYLLSLPAANTVSYQMGYLQLCTRCFGYLSDSCNAVVGS